MEVIDAERGDGTGHGCIGDQCEVGLRQIGLHGVCDLLSSFARLAGCGAGCNRSGHLQATIDIDDVAFGIQENNFVILAALAAIYCTNSARILAIHGGGWIADNKGVGANAVIVASH